MKKAFLQVFMGCVCLCAQAQKVSNIRAEQRGQDIVVMYLLETNLPCEVSLLVSQNNGTSWSIPLKKVSGDVFKNVVAGEKQIIWKVLDERQEFVAENLKFKILANEMKAFEHDMVFIQGGTFLMGSSSGEADEEPIHWVKLNSFNIGKYEVTQEQWKVVMGSNPSIFSGCDNCPVESVSWNDVQQYITKLNSQTGKNYRLPTEAEWEFAARGGTSSRGYNYSGSNNWNSVAWFKENSGNMTHEVGGKLANELGIYDMSGNVNEWCSDRYGNYSSNSETNPSGASSGQYHVFRGGNMLLSASDCFTANRERSTPDFGISTMGFRLVLPVAR
jgi:formylglycine-generating enzyme required for sulfatase activity